MPAVYLKTAYYVKQSSLCVGNFFTIICSMAYMRYADPLEIVLKRWTISVYVTLIKWPFLSAYCIDRVQTRLDNADLKSS